MEKKKTVGNMAQRRQILHQGTNFAVREAYKTLRTNIHFTLSDKPCKRICITSGSAGEGKSITMLNLALSVAESGQKVLLIDADLRRPAIGRLLVERIAPGLSNVLTEQVSIEDAIRQQVFPNLDILFSGEVPPNPSELLASDKFAALIEEMSKRYDYILVDAEEEAALAQQYRVMQAPTFVVVDKEGVHKYVNASNIKKYVDSFIDK